MMYHEKPPPTHLCKLEDGHVLSYDACDSRNDHAYDMRKFRYIGKGVIWTIRGVQQDSTETCYFYVYA